MEYQIISIISITFRCYIWQEIIRTVQGSPLDLMFQYGQTFSSSRYRQIDMKVKSSWTQSILGVRSSHPQEITFALDAEWRTRRAQALWKTSQRLHSSNECYGTNPTQAPLLFLQQSEHEKIITLDQQTNLSTWQYLPHLSLSCFAQRNF